MKKIIILISAFLMLSPVVFAKNYQPPRQKATAKSTDTVANHSHRAPNHHGKRYKF